MDPLSLSTIAGMSGSTLLSGNPHAKALRVSKDTRTLQAGDLYVALSGGNFNGNHFLAEAANKGAVGAICDAEPPVGLPEEFGILSVPDSLSGLTLFASAWRAHLSLRPVVVTGSSGKTSTKDMAARVLASRFKVTATEGNWNNQIGLPLSILGANLEDQAAVWEIGMNHRGEIAPLAGLARPEIAIITGIGTAHLEYLGTREEIAREKGDLLEKLPPSGCGIIPAHDEFAGELRSRTSARMLEVGFESGDLRASEIEIGKEGSSFRISGVFGEARASLPVHGRHMIANALLAVAAGALCGIPLEECAASLNSIELSGGRLGRVMRRGVTLLDDTYNANPDSMVAALETLFSLPGSGRKIAMLGRMGELGSHAAEGYERVGKAAALTTETLVCVGPEAAAIGDAALAAGLGDVRFTGDNTGAATLLAGLARKGDLVLLKGSRSARLEEILQQFH